MSTGAMLLLILGFFLVGGTYSLWKQKLPIGVVVVIGLAAAASLTAGALRA